jgi:hypothetical protein
VRRGVMSREVRVKRRVMRRIVMRRRVNMKSQQRVICVEEEWSSQ